ncbi:MAG TPA: TIGR03435 family protein, partial [Bryobacteraceae bacterium]
CLFLFAACLFSQPAPLTFDVASIKPSAPGTPGLTDFLPGGGFRATAVTLKRLVFEAYDVKPYQVPGGPPWTGSDRFDIRARPDRPGTNQQVRERLRNLLADRFQLVIHRETKELPVYALVVAKNGSKFQESSDGRRMMRGAPGLLSGQGVGMPQLAASLSGPAGRPVIDKTGLTGLYNFELKWTPDSPQVAPGPLPPGVPPPPPPDPNAPSLFTALPEQLGLRLESQKAPVEILVIDHAEKPSDN